MVDNVKTIYWRTLVNIPTTPLITIAKLPQKIPNTMLCNNINIKFPLKITSLDLENFISPEFAQVPSLQDKFNSKFPLRLFNTGTKMVNCSNTRNGNPSSISLNSNFDKIAALNISPNKLMNEGIKLCFKTFWKSICECLKNYKF
eukprot:NODE_22_length_42145_cov_1.310612.p31 type:complete len:145 gc:universal NODE_22_length_42145_cov_1.310612:35462-35896(+)